MVTDGLEGALDGGAQVNEQTLAKKRGIHVDERGQEATLRADSRGAAPGTKHRSSRHLRVCHPGRGGGNEQSGRSSAKIELLAARIGAFCEL